MGGEIHTILKDIFESRAKSKWAELPWYSELQDFAAGCLVCAGDSQVRVRYPAFPSLSLGGRDVGQEFWKAFQYYCWEREKQVLPFLSSFLACVFSQAVIAVTNWTGKQIRKTLWGRREIWIFHNQSLGNRHKYPLKLYLYFFASTSTIRLSFSCSLYGPLRLNLSFLLLFLPYGKWFVGYWLEDRYRVVLFQVRGRTKLGSVVSWVSALSWLVENRHHCNYFSLLNKSSGCPWVLCGMYTCALLGWQ